MELVIVGPIDGDIKSLYSNLNPAEVSWVLSTGDLGVWPDPAKIDRATRRKSEVQDFAELYITGFQAPIPTLFVAGVHEDHRWLEQRKHVSEGMEVLGEVNWLMNGFKTIIGDASNTLRVTGLGKVYSESTFSGKFNRKSYRHYTRRELEKGCASGPTDILLLHEEPSKEARTLIFATRPKLIIHAAKDFRQYKLLEVPTYGLPKLKMIKVSYDGNELKVQ